MQSNAAKYARNRDDNDGFSAIHGKTESEMKSSGAMQWSSQSPHMSPRSAFRGMATHVMRREDTNIAKQVTTMKVGGKRHRGRPRLRWMDRVQSDMEEHQLAARTKARTEHASMKKCSNDDRLRKGIRSAKVSKRHSINKPGK